MVRNITSSNGKSIPMTENLKNYAELSTTLYRLEQGAASLMTPFGVRRGGIIHAEMPRLKVKVPVTLPGHYQPLLRYLESEFSAVSVEARFESDRLGAKK